MTYEDQSEAAIRDGAKALELAREEMRAKLERASSQAVSAMLDELTKHEAPGSLLMTAVMVAALYHDRLMKAAGLKP